jgi:hypothetical protein
MGTQSQARFCHPAGRGPDRCGCIASGRPLAPPGIGAASDRIAGPAPGPAWQVCAFGAVIVPRASDTRMFRSRSLAPLLIVALAAPAQAQVVFDVDFDGSTGMLTAGERDQVAAHLKEAGRRWAAAMSVNQPRSIQLRVGIAAIATANGGSLGSAFVGVIDGRDTFEQGVAYELRTGIDPNGTDADGQVNFGLDYLRNELWFDPDPVARTAPVPLNRTDALSIALHELGHIIAYNGWADLTTGVPPPTYWSVFDRWMSPGAPTLFAGPWASSLWGATPDLTTGNNKHWGNPPTDAPVPAGPRRRQPPVRWLDGRPVPTLACDLPLSIAAPAPGSAAALALAQGSGLVDQLMNGLVVYRGTRYDIAALDHGTLLDVGALFEPLFRNGFE